MKLWLVELEKVIGDHGMTNWLRVLGQTSIQQPYYRVVCPACYGNNAGKNFLGVGSYWTPRWNGVIEMLRTIMSFYLKSGKNLNAESFQTKIYKLDDAIMEDPPSEHSWAFNFASDADEQVLVKALSPPELLYNINPYDSQFQDLIATDYEPDVNYYAGEKARWRGQPVFIVPDYDRRKIEVAVKNDDGFRVIHTINSAEELNKLWGEILLDDNSSSWLDYFPSDVGWV